MSLKRKIVLSFFVSTFIIAILTAFEYFNFIEIRKEIRYLEITDTIRSKSLQLRRHEKNFFLYGYPTAHEEAKATHQYLIELDEILNKNLKIYKTDKLYNLRELVNEYKHTFNSIELSLKDLSKQLKNANTSYERYSNFFPLIEFTFFERPAQAAEFLEKIFLLPANHSLIKGLKVLDSEINALRKTGEDIIIISKELDWVARENAENIIHISQIAILIFFPLFFFSGIGTLFFISRNIVSRLKLLINTVEKTSKGDFSQVVGPYQKWGGDEVGVLIKKFNKMAEQLAQRENELNIKNAELFQSKKLAVIGTLASCVAHELNNPLNNICISAQILSKEIDDNFPVVIKETVNDILSQTIRVKGIVRDLLEFARVGEPKLRKVELNNLINRAYEFINRSINTKKVHFAFDSTPEEILLYVDPEQMERVFINLFSNAVDAMSQEGVLTVNMKSRENIVFVKISDTGRGMSPETVEKIFDPFFTTKDKGSGLGLTIVLNIIKKHNGEISVRSEEGHGTTFIITLSERNI